MARLIAPNGGSVQVADDKVDGLLRRGFTRTEEPKKAPAKKSAPKKSDK